MDIKQPFVYQDEDSYVKILSRGKVTEKHLHEVATKVDDFVFTAIEHLTKLVITTSTKNKPNLVNLAFTRYIPLPREFYQESIYSTHLETLSHGRTTSGKDEYSSAYTRLKSLYLDVNLFKLVDLHQTIDFYTVSRLNLHSRTFHLAKDLGYINHMFERLSNDFTIIYKELVTNIHKHNKASSRNDNFLYVADLKNIGTYRKGNDFIPTMLNSYVGALYNFMLHVNMMYHSRGFIYPLSIYTTNKNDYNYASENRVYLNYRTLWLFFKVIEAVNNIGVSYYSKRILYLKDFKELDLYATELYMWLSTILTPRDNVSEAFTRYAKTSSGNHIEAMLDNTNYQTEPHLFKLGIPNRDKLTNVHNVIDFMLSHYIDNRTEVYRSEIEEGKDKVHSLEVKLKYLVNLQKYIREINQY